MTDLKPRLAWLWVAAGFFFQALPAALRGRSRTSHHRFGRAAAGRWPGRISPRHGPRLGAVDAHLGRGRDHSEFLHFTHQTAERLSRDSGRRR